MVLETFGTKVVSLGTRTVTEKGLGTGVVVDKRGWIVTAAHVVHNSDAVHVLFSNG